jgi:acetolactate synthase-1/3 small subunit
MMTQHVIRHCLAILVANEPGVLARVIGLFSGRGYNIESLAVAEVDGERHLSRITIVTSGTNDIVNQIKAQLGRLVPVQRVVDLGEAGAWIEREMALLKVAAEGASRVEVLRLAEAGRARVIDGAASPLVFHFAGTPDEVSRFLEQMRPHGLIEVVRTGTVGIGMDERTL